MQYTKKYSNYILAVVFKLLSVYFKSHIHVYHCRIKEKTSMLNCAAIVFLSFDLKYSRLYN